MMSSFEASVFVLGTCSTVKVCVEDMDDEMDTTSVSRDE